MELPSRMRSGARLLGPLAADAKGAEAKPHAATPAAADSLRKPLRDLDIINSLGVTGPRKVDPVRGLVFGS